MLSIGLITSKWSSERILSIAKEYENEIRFIPFLFDSLDDIPRILDENKPRIHKWLLSGPLPFHVAKWHLKSDEDLLYCRITEAGLLKTILEISYRNNSFLESFSLDFIDEAVNIDEMLDEIQIPREGISIFRYKIPVDEKALFQAHLALWERKATRCAVTTVPFVYSALKDLGVPVYSIQVTQMEIRWTIELLIEKSRSLYFRNTQLGLLIIEICDYEKVAENAQTPYGLQLLELKVSNALLAYCQQIGGYLVPKGNGRYEIFGSRGKIESNSRMLREELERISLELNTHLIAGVGFGETVFLAQINSNKALHHARNANGIVVFRGDGDIVELLGEGEELRYSSYSEDAGLNERLAKARVGIRTYRKMRAVTRRIGEDSFSASALAKQMGVTDRNIRRIVSGLLDAGLLACVGEESSGVSGRPAKLYRFLDEVAGPGPRAAAGQA